MSDKEQQHAVSGAQNADEAEQNVDKIREILFGGQMRDYQRRFDKLESSINAASEQLRNDLNGRVESLEGFVRRELELLTERLGAERHERGQEREDAAAELQETRRRFQQSIDRLAEQTTQEARGLRGALDARGNELAQVIQQGRDEFNAVLSRHANDLEQRKVGREDLAAMLSELAQRLDTGSDPASD